MEPIHSRLEEKDFLPDEHLLDAGYPTAENLVNSKTQYNIEIIGPVRSDPSWQTKAQQGFDSSNFQIDWDNEKVTCPQGHQGAMRFCEVWSKTSDR
ncbi:hypothetical protein [Nostoc sp. 'Peltigera membranacea cyanobiont' N6]|uniref:hypothetical protein n=1 Tax=Nostoc sp. 'Peltigera membranacea cyanobiont' N6 TaxID=1261031 RepID=UPI0015E3D567